MAGSAQRSENSAELLSNGRLDVMLQYIASIDPHALVIVDLPPVLSTADVLTVAPRLSALLIVASEGFTRREDLANAVATIGETRDSGGRHCLEPCYRGQSGRLRLLLNLCAGAAEWSYDALWVGPRSTFASRYDRISRLVAAGKRGRDHRPGSEASRRSTSARTACCTH